jgi:hypothetical protein
MEQHQGMSTRPPLPLSEQILFWIVRAIGRGEGRFPAGGPSWSTAKRAGRAEVLRDWDLFVRTCLGAIGVDAPQAALDTVRVGLRRWDGRVGQLPPTSELTELERLHPVLLWVIPTLGLRLGAFAAAIAWKHDAPVGEWAWVTDPFARNFFANVVDGLLHAQDPKLTTRQRRKEDLDGVIDPRTYERWFGGETGIPEIAGIEKLVDYLGSDAEGPLRLARLAAVLREDLTEAIGPDSLKEWCDAVQAVAMPTARLLREPTALAMLCELLAVDLRGPHGANLLSVLGVPPDGAPDALAAGLSAFAPRLRESPISTEARTVGFLLLVHQAAFPHPKIGEVVGTDLGAPMMGIQAAGDPLAGSSNPWALRILCKSIATKDVLELQTADGTMHSRPVPRAIAEAAGRWLAVSLRFRHLPGEEPEAHAMAVLWWLAGEPKSIPLDLMGALAGMLGPDIEPDLPDEQVEASAHLASLRARRLAEAGNHAEAARWLEHATRAPAGSGAAEHIAATQLAMIHATLDATGALLWQLRGRQKGSTVPPQRTRLLEILATVEHVVGAAEKWLAAPEDAPETLERIAAILPAKLRVARLRRALGEEGSGIDGQAVGRDVEQLREGLTRYPNRGSAWCSLAVWERWSGGDAELSCRRARHWGAGERLDREMRRLDGYLSEDAGAEEA